MITRRSFATLASATGGLLWLMLLASSTGHAAPDRVRVAVGRLSVPFIENQGQVDPQVAYYAPTFAGTLFVTRRGDLIYALRDGSLTETLRAGTARPVGSDRSVSRVSHFLGADAARWRPGVPSFDRVSLGEVWPGVTVTLRAGGRSVEKIFTLSPGIPVDRIRVSVGGADSLSVNAEGALIAGTALGQVTFTAPVAYQEPDGTRRQVAVAYRLVGTEYGFSVGPHDPSLPLVIDPLLQSTYLGGNLDEDTRALAIHPATGDVYVAGSTNSGDFPGTPPNFRGNQAFVARLSSDLKTLIHATLLGGNLSDEATGIAIDASSGDVYVTGQTASSDFPGTAGGAQPAGPAAGFVARLSADLTALIQATYLGGSQDAPGLAGPFGIAIHPSNGGVYVVGDTFSPDFPGTAGGAQPARPGHRSAFVARLNSALTALVQATYFGGSSLELGEAIAIDPATGDVYLAGKTSSSDLPGVAGAAQPTPPLFASQSVNGGYVARLNAGLTAIVRATYLGGNGSNEASAVAIHPMTGEVYVAGVTSAIDFPGTIGGADATLGGTQDAFVARLDAGLTTILRATYFGGTAAEANIGLAIHPITGDVYITGFTSSDDLPGRGGGVQPAKVDPFSLDGFVARFPRSLGALAQSTYLGGTSGDTARVLAIHPGTGDVYAAGGTNSTDFPGVAGGAQPTKNGAADRSDAWIAHLTSSLAATDPPPGPNLALTKAHDAHFFLGATYTLVVTNIGTTASAGPVTVVDTLPAGLTPVALTGLGWTCVLATLTCTRADALASGDSYPDILLTVSVADDVAPSVVNTATVSGGGDTTPANNTATDPTRMHTFDDVPADSPFRPFIDALARNGLTAGCTTVEFCPDVGITREQVAVFLVRAVHGTGFDPPAATGRVFGDVPASSVYARWIEQLARDGITGGCSITPPLYCPGAMTTRGQIAVLLLRARHGPAFQPPPATGTVFADVPASHPFADWIEELHREGITGGCSATNYCPDAVVTRAQIAVFLVRAFNLPM